MHPMPARSCSMKQCASASTDRKADESMSQDESKFDTMRLISGAEASDLYSLEDIVREFSTDEPKRTEASASSRQKEEAPVIKSEEPEPAREEVAQEEAAPAENNRALRVPQLRRRKRRRRRRKRNWNRNLNRSLRHTKISASRRWRTPLPRRWPILLRNGLW